MELAILIAKQIGSMFLMILTGVVLRKCNVVDANAGKSLSKIAVNVVLPCTIINAFQIDYSREVSTGLLFALGMAFLCNLVLTLLPYGLKHLKLTPIEQASFSYPNCGEILLPLVASVLSKEMQIYCCGFIIVQILFLFTHGTALLKEEKTTRVSDVLKNVNVIAILIGFLLFILPIHIPQILNNTISSFSEMIAPVCMLVIGMAIGECNWKEILSDKRSYLISFMRLVISPLLFLLLFKLTKVYTWIDNGKDILLVVFLATASSPAATVANLAQNYGKNAGRASIINVLSVCFMIVTMPIMVMLYQYLL